MFQKVAETNFIRGEHAVLSFWDRAEIFRKLREKNAGNKKWSFLDGPITANNPMGVHHAWGRTYKDAFQRYFAMTGHELRYQNGFDCQGLWVEVEVEKELGLGTKTAIKEFGIDKFVNACKRRVLNFAARQTEQSIRLGYWMEWDSPTGLRMLAEHVGKEDEVEYTTPRQETVKAPAHRVVERLGNPDWGGSYFTFSTENNETIWTFLKKCYERGKVYRGHDVMPWSGRGGSAYSQMEIADGRKLSVHRSVFVKFPLLDDKGEQRLDAEAGCPENLLIWTTTPWTLTSNVAAMINPELDYVKIKTKRDGQVYYFAKENLNFKRLQKESKEGFGRPEWGWPEDVPKLKTLKQIFKERGGFDEVGSVKGAEMVGWKYRGPFDDLPALGWEVESHPHLQLAEMWKHWLLQLEDPNDPWADQPVVVCENIFNWLHSFFPPATGAKSVVISDISFQIFTKLKELELRKTAELISGKEFEDLCRDEIVELIRTFVSELKQVSKTPANKRHSVIDGGRDNKGNPNVVSGEGTGIVHSAPGCGDIDHKIGVQFGLPDIAPLGEDGRFGEGFGEFTGMEAIDPKTVDLVLQKLEEKELLVAVEKYPHIYPHCWRTGDELVFRLVDEWFINMDWRDEIKDVTKAIEWLPESIDGQNREIEWLTNMRDWMISKKRFWGLALPIWINPEDPTDFEVVGSLAELKEKCVEGWDDFEGNTPHRPWIDNVKIKSSKSGATLSRIEDVGNPWLDAGITPYSTMGYNTHRKLWEDWFPADLVTECFPGQFRNWFYSLLSLSTMMRYDETDDPNEKRPFKTLLGHRLVMDELGRPMHKSDGTAIWFEEAAEQLGVDTLRWMYLAQNPAVDLRFGLRHPDQPVEIPTPEGPIKETKEGAPTCLVTSGPADEVRRQSLIPLWNSYAFFVNYARLDGFKLSDETIPVSDRPEIDRWILSRLQSLIGTAHKSFQSYDTSTFMGAVSGYIDDLSNWYIRRNRRRFWRSQDGADQDKRAAYQTLHQVLVTLCQLLAPVTPFFSERLYQNLVLGRDLLGEGESTEANGDWPESVHLCDYPQVDESLLDEGLNQRTSIAQQVVKLGHQVRESVSMRVRQPLAELRVACETPEQAEAVSGFASVIQDELNVKQVNVVGDLEGIVQYSYKPNLKTLGPKYGKLLKAIGGYLQSAPAEELAPIRMGKSVQIQVGDDQVILEPQDVLVNTEQATDWGTISGEGLQVALSTELNEQLIIEGMARDLVRQIQQLRKEAGLEIEDRIVVTIESADDQVAKLIDDWSEYIQSETLADGIKSEGVDASATEVTVGNSRLKLQVKRVPAS